ncbi:MAG: tetratricopeptide repeat protein [Desulfarculus sp.]|nr:tetratricopeptide repeat protein [Desulfarculus sp.]
MKPSNWIGGLLVAACLLTANPAWAQPPAFEHYNQGVQLAAQGRLAEAKAAFDQALRLDPHALPVLRCQAVLADVGKRIKQQTAVHLFRAFLAFNRHKPDEAIQELNQAAQMDPNYALTYSHRADAYRDKRQIKEALADYDKALALDPKFAVAYVNRANLRGAQGQLDLAVADFSRALALEPRNVPAYYGRGNALGQQGRHQQAIADYDALLAINPAFPHAYVKKGLAWEALKRPQEALAAYKAYLQKLDLRRQDPQQVKWVQDKVKSLEK